MIKVGKMNRASRVYQYVVAISLKLVPVVILALALGTVAYAIDRNHVKNSPATDYINYTSFVVQNARVGEDVNFVVCRTYKQEYHVDSTLSIRVILNPGTQNEDSRQVYARDGDITITGNCDNKTVRNVDFAHQAGTYEMQGCIEFKVEYGFTKNLCTKSNQYRIYDTPLDLQTKYDQAIQQLEQITQQMKELGTTPNQGSGTFTPNNTGTSGNSSAPAPNRGTTPAPTNTNGVPPATSTPGSSAGTTPGGQTTTPPANNVIDGTRDLTCDVLGLLCR